MAQIMTADGHSLMIAISEARRCAAQHSGAHVYGLVVSGIDAVA
jgi:hypothetical protein